jgi:hypothetical protein
MRFLLTPHTGLYLLTFRCLHPGKWQQREAHNQNAGRMHRSSPFDGATSTVCQ